MKLKIEIDDSEAEEIMELARDLTDVVEALRKQVKELKRLCDEQKKFVLKPYSYCLVSQRQMITDMYSVYVAEL